MKDELIKNFEQFEALADVLPSAARPSDVTGLPHESGEPHAVVPWAEQRTSAAEPVVFLPPERLPSMPISSVGGRFEALGKVIHCFGQHVSMPHQIRRMEDRKAFQFATIRAIETKRFAAQSRDAASFPGHDSQGFAANKINAVPPATTQDRIDMMFEAMLDSLLCIDFLDVCGLRISRKFVVTRPTLNAIDDCQSLGVHSCIAKQFLKNSAACANKRLSLLRLHLTGCFTNQ